MFLVFSYLQRITASVKTEHSWIKTNYSIKKKFSYLKVLVIVRAYPKARDKAVNH
jgi:hypothetical protein